MKVIVNNFFDLVKIAPLLMFFLLCGISKGNAKPPLSNLYKYPASEQAQHYPKLNYTLIELIKALPKPLPTTLKKAKALFNNEVYYENEHKYFRNYTGGPFITQDGVVVPDVTITIGKTNKHPVEFIGFSLDQKQCVNVKLLRKKFNLNVGHIKVSHPTTKDFPIGFAADLKWGDFEVDTTMENNNCATGFLVNLD